MSIGPIGTPGNQDSRRRVLDAARAQVRRYGVGKTTVQDIARVLGTSHTALYRHFPSKQAILEALAGEAMEADAAAAGAELARPGPAAARIMAAILAVHRAKLRRLAQDPELHGLAVLMMTQRPDLVAGWMAAIREVLARAIRDGIALGEFAATDAESAAQALLVGCAAFLHPGLVAQNAGQPTEEWAEAVVGLMLDGLARRSPVENGLS